MARKPRIHVDGGVYHVILRGNAGQKIFYSKTDRTKFSLLIQEGVERFKYRVHAFCFMTNHIHIIIQVSHIPLSKAIQNLSFRYTKFINKKKNQIGHLFQGRYKAILVDADAYLLELVRYIHLNPVRAHLVKDPVEYPYSSHKAYLGLESISYLTSDWVLSLFGKRLSSCQEKFRQYVLQDLHGKSKMELYGRTEDSRILGDDSFLDQILNRPASTLKKVPLDTIIQVICKEFEVDAQLLLSQSRNRKLVRVRGMIGLLSIMTESATLTTVAKQLNRDLSSISKAVKKVEEESGRSNKQQSKIEQLIKALQ